MNKDYLNNLNKEQKEAVFSDAKDTLIIAGAGTGKTHTLVARIVRFLSAAIQPGHGLTHILTSVSAYIPARTVA